MKKRSLLLTVVILLGIVAWPGAAQRIEGVEFINAPVADILVALGLAAGRTVVPDDTVDGIASYHLESTDFHTALASIAERYGLFITEADGVIKVSRFTVQVNDDNTISIQAELVQPESLVRGISRAIRTPILFDPLPAGRISLFVDGARLVDVLELICESFGSIELVSMDGSYLLRRSDRPSRVSTLESRNWFVAGENGYSADIDHATLIDALDALSRAADREYQLLASGTEPIDGFRFTGRTFDEMLQLLLERVDCRFTLFNGIYYITDGDPRAAGLRTSVTRRIELRNISATTLIDLLPSTTLIGVELRLDRSNDVATISGQPEMVERLAAIIAQIDVPITGRDYYVFDLAHVSIHDLVARLPPSLARLALIPHPGSTSITAIATAEQAAELARHIRSIDTPPERHLFELQHITLGTLLASLPPTVERSQIVPAGDSSRFFFVGSSDGRDEFALDLTAIDRQVPRIRYELLVIQYHESEGSDFELGLTNRVAVPQSPHAILGNLGSLLSISFDIVSAFGYHFAAQLTSQIVETRAQIVADVVLRGSSGQRVRFQNTDTFRYRETNIASESAGGANAGFVREITSGLVVDITGQLVGDTTLLLDVTVSLSKRGVDVSAHGNPPPTSEKTIQTQIRAEVGHPVAIARFAYQERSDTTQGVPILSAIPFVSSLIGTNQQRVETGELAIYLVPHIDPGPQTAVDLEEMMCRLFTTFIGSRP